MSVEIVKNVVQMAFDNSSFEKNAGVTLETLDKLKQALNFEGAVKGIENIGSNVKNIGMDGLYNGVYKVQEGFNALDVVATRVLQNITDRVQNAVTNLASAAITQPLKDGFSEYELQMNSVQTITASTGESIATVNRYLDELNTYADKTIYSFSDMTANIGKFTNAGVSLDSAVAAIQGVSNVAAVSGANTQEASRAMYNFAQALSAGSVKLIDWKSIENANMATVEFKEQLIQTAVAMGTLTKEGDKYVSTTTDANGKVSEAFNATSMFNDSLSSQWMTTDVLVQTLEQYSTDVRDMSKDEREAYEEKLKGLGYTKEQIEAIEELGKKAADSAKDVKTFSQLIDTLKEGLGSGWTKTWQLVFGDLNEAKRLWSGIYSELDKVISKTSDVRNAILEDWSKAGYIYDKEGNLIKAVYDEEGNLNEELSKEIVKDGQMIREEMGGRELLIQGFITKYQTYSGIFSELGKALRHDFVGIDNDQIENISITGDKLKDLSLAYYDNAQAFKEMWSPKYDEDGNLIGLLGELQDSFEFFSTSLRRGYDSIVDIFSGLGNIFKAFSLSEFFNIGTLDYVLTIFSSFTGMMQDFGEAFKKHFGNDEAGNNKNGLITFFNAILHILEEGFFIKLNFVKEGFEALGKIIEHLVEPFGTFSELLGKIGDKGLKFSDALAKMFMNEDVSKFEPYFESFAESFNKFIDKIRKRVDFSGFSEAFNTILKTMTSDKVDLFGTFTKVIDSIVNVFKAFIQIATPVIAAFVKIFGPEIMDGAKWLGEVWDRIEKLTESFVKLTSPMKGIQTFFEGLFKVVKAVAEIIGQSFLDIWDGLADAFSKILPSSKDLSTLLKDSGKKLSDFADNITKLSNNENGVPKLSEVISGLVGKFKHFFDIIRNINLLEKLEFLFSKLGDGIKRALGGTEDMTLLDTIAEKIKGFLDKLKEVFSDENGGIDLVKVFEAGGIGLVIKKFLDFIKDLKDSTNNMSGIFGFINDFKDIFESLADSFEGKFKAENIKAIATAMLEMAGAMFILSMIDPGALAKAVAAMASMFHMIERVLVILSSLDKGKVAAGAGAIAAVGTAMVELSIAVTMLGNMDAASMMQGLLGVTILLAELTGVAYAFSKFDKDLAKGAGGLIALAIALNLLIIPVKIFSTMSMEELAKGLGSVTVLLVELTGAAILLGKFGKDFKASTAIGLILMAEAIKVLAKAVIMIQDVSWEALGKGLAMMTAALVEMIGSAAIISKAKLGDELMTVATSLMLLGISMNLLVTAAQGISNVSWEDLGKLAAVLAGALVALGIASYAINGKNLLMIGAAIALVATAFVEFEAAMGLAQIVGPLCTSIGMAIEGMSHSLQSFARNEARKAFLDFIKDAILLLPELAVSLANALIEMIVTLGNGAVKLVGAIENIGRAILQGLSGLLPDLFNILGTFFSEIWTFLKEQIPQVFEVLTVFFDQLWPFLTTQTPKFFDFLTLFFDEVWTFLTGQVPNFFEFLKTVFNELFIFLQTEGPTLIETIRLFLDTVLQAIIQEAPVIGEAFLAVLHTILDVINVAIPEITQTLLNLLLALLTQLAEYVPQIADTAMQIILGFLNAISENIGQITEAAIDIAIAFMDGLAEKMPELVDSAFNLIIQWIDGLATAIENNHDALWDAIGHLIQSIVDAILDGISKVVNAGGQMLSDFTSGLNAQDIIDGIFNAGVNLVQGFIDGILSLGTNVWNAACNLASNAWNAITQTLDEHSPSRLTFGGGQNFTQGFIGGILSLLSQAEDASSSIGHGAIQALDDVLSNNTTSFEPKISPIFDSSNISNGITGYLGDVDTTIGGVATINSTIEANNALKAQMADVIASGNDYTEIIGSIRSLSDELSEYNSNISNLQIVMDSGTLVGELTPGIDVSLGRVAALSRRGV